MGCTRCDLISLFCHSFHYPATYFPPLSLFCLSLDLLSLCLSVRACLLVFSFSNCSRILSLSPLLWRGVCFLVFLLLQSCSQLRLPQFRSVLPAGCVSGWLPWAALSQLWCPALDHLFVIHSFTSSNSLPSFVFKYLVWDFAFVHTSFMSFSFNS